ncbi:MAG: hypothetical protein U9P10_03975 [Thermodesulfobacteriota bacterium]|nr:hypothetical protein [Thermodesulfobacteriota bacterium]
MSGALKFAIRIKKFENDLFINLSGEFNGSSAWELANTIFTRFQGQGRVFIETRDLTSVLPFGAEMIVNLIPKLLLGKESVLIRDSTGVYCGLDHFRKMVKEPVKIKGNKDHFSKASIC